MLYLDHFFFLYAAKLMFRTCRVWKSLIFCLLSSEFAFCICLCLVFVLHDTCPVLFNKTVISKMPWEWKLIARKMKYLCTIIPLYINFVVRKKIQVIFECWLLLTKSSFHWLGVFLIQNCMLIKKLLSFEWIYIT